MVVIQVAILTQFIVTEAVTQFVVVIQVVIVTQFVVVTEVTSTDLKSLMKSESLYPSSWLYHTSSWCAQTVNLYAQMVKF